MSLASPHRTTGELITASIWNTDLVDALNSIQVSADGLSWQGDLAGTATKTGPTNGSLNGHTLTATLNKAASGTHPGFSGLVVSAPVLGGGGAVVTAAATLVVSGAPTGGVDNFALLVTGSGGSQVQGPIALYTDVNMGISFSDARVSGVVATTVTGYVGPLSNSFAVRCTSDDPLILGSNNTDTVKVRTTGTSWQFTGVAHGMTTLAETDTYCLIAPFGGAAGGAIARGLGESTVGFQIDGFATTDVSSPPTVASLAPVVLNAGIKSGTTSTSLGAATLIAVLQNNSQTQFAFGSTGDMFYNGSAPVTYDQYDDIALARSLDLVLGGPDVIESAWDRFVQYGRADLERAGIVTPGGFVSLRNHTRLLNGTVWQLYTMVQELRGEIAALKGAA